jgi:hypothetical protein
MANIKIKNIIVTLAENNSCHKTLDNLVCDVCRKRVQRVYALRPEQNDDVRFACLNGICFTKLFEEMFMVYEDRYLLACSIEDINYSSKKATKKRVRSEMTLKLRYKILKRDNFRCVTCGRRPPGVELCVDHIIPVAKGGTNSEDNLRTLCTDCNLGKGME